MLRAQTFQLTTTTNAIFPFPLPRKSPPVRYGLSQWENRVARYRSPAVRCCVCYGHWETWCPELSVPGVKSRIARAESGWAILPFRAFSPPAVGGTAGLSQRFPFYFPFCPLHQSLYIPIHFPKTQPQCLGSSVSYCSGPVFLLARCGCCLHSPLHCLQGPVAFDLFLNGR